MDTFAPLVPASEAMQCIARAQDALVDAGGGAPGLIYIQAFHGAKRNDPLTDLMPEQAANLIYALTGAGEHTRAILAYALRGLGFRIVAVPDVAAEPVQSDSLSPRERQLMEGLTRGLSNKLLAQTLGVTEATVKAHLKNLFRKLRAKNRTQAALLAARGL